MPSDTYCHPLAISEQIENLHSSSDFPSDYVKNDFRRRCDCKWMILSCTSGLAGFIAGVMTVYLFFPSLLTLWEPGQTLSSSKGSPILSCFEKPLLTIRSSFRGPAVLRKQSLWRTTVGYVQRRMDRHDPQYVSMQTTTSCRRTDLSYHSQRGVASYWSARPRRCLITMTLELPVLQ